MNATQKLNQLIDDLRDGDCWNTAKYDAEMLLADLHENGFNVNVGSEQVRFLIIFLLYTLKNS